MAGLLTHRGPDERGAWIGADAGLASRRLAIVDVAGGQQPVRDPESGAIAVLNGEIYGFAELRRELAAGGYRFRTRSDTEVLLAGFLAWGEDVLTRIDGMLACAIYLPRTRELVLARDRLGQKPLYYTTHGDCLYFASEMKALLALPGATRRLDPAATEQFLLFEHVFDPMTPFVGIRALPPAHFVRLRAERPTDVVPRRYWSVPLPDDSRAAAKRDEVIEELGSLLDDAVRRRLSGDVPVGALLSGGLDSSLVCQALRRTTSGPIDAFAITFSDRRFDESSYQDAVAQCLGLRMHRFEFDARARAVVESYSASLWSAEYADLAFEQDVLIQHVTALAASQGYKVLLGGEGADELFRGYRHYALYPHAMAYAASRDLEVLPPELDIDDDEFADYADHEVAGTRALGMPCSLLRPFFPWEHVLDPAAFRALAAELFVSPPPRATLALPPLPERRPPHASGDFLQWMELHTRLPSYILRTLDRYSMASGVEVRCPFLDHRLFELAARLPRALRDEAPSEKRLLRALATDLPREVVERPKQGFRAPYLLTESLRRPEGRDALHALLARAPVEALEVVRPELVEAHLDLYARLPDDDDSRPFVRRVMLMRILALRMLHSVFVEDFEAYRASHLATFGEDDQMPASG